MSRADDGRNIMMRHRQKPAVHELDQGVQLIVMDVVEEKHGMRMHRRGRRLMLLLVCSMLLMQQHRFEERRASTQD